MGKNKNKKKNEAVNTVNTGKLGFNYDNKSNFNTMPQRQYMYHEVVKEEKKPLLKMVNGSSEHINVFIKKDVLDKIKYICKEIPNNEWSGSCFYTAEGSIKDPKSLILRVNDIFPMDYGVAAYTEFTYGSEHAGYMATHPELMDGFAGIIHSHNKMDAFFSGTDTATLAEIAPDHKMFLSIVVNNAGKIVAMLTIYSLMKSEIEFTEFDYSKGKMSRQKEIVLKYECDIIKEGEEYSDEEFKTIVKELIEDSNKHHQQRNIYTFNKTYHNPDLFNRQTDIDEWHHKHTGYNVTTNTEKYVESDVNVNISNKEKKRQLNFLYSLISISFFNGNNDYVALHENVLIKDALKMIPANLDKEEYEGMIFNYIDDFIAFHGYETEEDQLILLDSCIQYLKGYKESGELMKQHEKEIIDAVLSVLQDVAMDLMDEELNEEKPGDKENKALGVTDELIY